jgi:hypothetical protein
VAIVLQVINWVSTATIQLPIQFELSANGLSPPLIERLIETNFWLRRIPYAAAAGLFLWMGSKSLQAAGDSPAAQSPPGHVDTYFEIPFVGDNRRAA